MIMGEIRNIGIIVSTTFDRDGNDLVIRGSLKLFGKSIAELAYENLLTLNLDDIYVYTNLRGVALKNIFGKKVKPINFLYILIALIGSYMVAVKEDFSLELGDILTLICALSFAAQIVIIDIVNPHINSIKLSAIQFVIAGVLSFIIMIITEGIDLNQINQKLINH